MSQNRIVISPKAYLLEGDIEQNKKKYPEQFSRASNFYDQSFQYGSSKGGGVLIAHDQAAKHSKFEANSLLLSTLNDNKSIAIETGLDLQKLRFSLTYFDKIVLPNTSCGTDFVYKMPEIGFLDSENIIDRPVVNTSNCLSIGQSFYNCFLEAEELAGIHVYDQDIHSEASGYTSIYESILLDVYNSFPVPSIDTSLEDILEFKVKRKDELEQLQEELQDIESLITRNSSQEEIHKQILAIYGDLEKIDQVMAESKIKRILISRTIEIKTPELLNFTIGTGTGIGVDLVTTGGVGLISLGTSLIMSFLDFPEKMPKNINKNLKYILDLRDHFKINTASNNK